MSLSLPFDSSNWRKPAFSTPLNQRIELAQAALDKSVANLTSDGQFQAPQFYYQSGLLYSQMAEFDLVSNQTRYKDKLAGFLEAREREREGTNPFLRDGLVYGYAAARSYLAYKDPKYLSYAVNWWSWAEKWTISEANVASGALDGKDFTLQTECNGKTVVGGSFDSTANNRKNGVVSTMSTGHFLTLSSLLHESTQNQTYLSHAKSSYDFIRSHLLPSSGYLPQHSIPLDSADRTKCTTAGSIDSGNAGVWIEGAALYGSLIGGNEKDSIGEMLQGTFTSAVGNGEWNTNPERVLRNNPSSLLPNLNLPRGLTTMYQRNTSEVLRIEVEKYLAVQYNAILDRATSQGSNLYLQDWTTTGTPSEFNVDGQISAQQLLVSSISLLYTPVVPSPIDPGSSDNNNGNNKGSNASVIGGAIGGILGLVLLILGLFLFLRRRRRRNQAAIDEVHNARVEQPFSVSQVGQEGQGESLSPLRPGMPIPALPLPSPSPSLGNRGYLDEEKAPLPSPSSPGMNSNSDVLLSENVTMRSRADGDRATHLQEDIQRLQTGMQHILEVLNQNQRSSSTADLNVVHSEGEGMENYPPPPEYPGNARAQ